MPAMARTDPHRSPLDSTAGRLVLLAVLLAVCLPLLLDTYHLAVSDWFHRDDYAPVLLWLVDGGPAPAAPFGYRPLSVLPAWPLYEALPLYRLSHGMDRPEPWLRATQALVLVSWASVAGLAFTVFATARDRLRTSAGAALAAGLATLILVPFTGVVGVDPLGLLAVALLWNLLDRPLPLAAGLVASAALNEKVALVFGLLLLVRAARGDRHPLPLAGAGLGLALVLGMRLLGPLEGAEHQLAPGGFLAQTLATLRLDLTPNGLVHALLPTGLALAGFAAATWGRAGRSTPWCRPEDGLTALGLFLLAHLLATNVGRVVLYSAPLFLPALALAVDRLSAPPGGDAP